MNQKYLLITVTFVLFTLISTSVALPGRAAQPVQARTGESPSQVDATLDICLANEPGTLFLYGQENPNLTQEYVWSAVYDGPTDAANFTTTAVILSAVPTSSNGGVISSQVQVTINDKVLDCNNNIVTIDPSSVIDLLQLDGSCAAHDFSVDPIGTTVQHLVTYTLLPGLEWEDGDDLTADDFLFSWEVSASPDVPYNKNIVERTLNIQALTQLSWEWTSLPGYWLFAPYLDGLPRPLPEHIYGDSGSNPLTPAQMLLDDDVNRDPLSYVAYKIDSWAAGSQIVLSKNTNYFRAGQGLPKFDALIYHITPDPLGELLNGTCDVILNDAAYDFSTLQYYDDQGYLELSVTPQNSYEHIDFNIQPASDYTGFAKITLFYQDSNLRKAIAYCIDRQALIDGPLNGAGYIAHLYMPPNHPYYPANPSLYNYDPPQGRALLAAAGWVDSNGNGTRDKNGVELSMRFMTSDSSTRRLTMPILSNQLKQNCGIQATPEYMDFGSFFGDLGDNRYDLAQYMWIVDSEPPCGLYLSNIAQNHPGYSSPPYGSACTTALNASDDAVKKANHQTAAEIFSQDLPSLPLYHPAKFTATGPNIQQFSIDTTGLILWNIEAIEPSVSATIPPSGGALEAQSDATSYDFPSGTFSESVTVNHIAMAPNEVPPPPTGSSALALAQSGAPLTGIGHFFEVFALNGQGQAVQPGQAYTLTIEYTNDELAGAREATLKLYYWDGAAWVVEPSAVLDAANNTITAQPDHFSIWAVFGEDIHVYLPLVNTKP